MVVARLTAPPSRPRALRRRRSAWETPRLSGEPRAGTAERDLAFGVLTNDISDDFGRTLVSGGGPLAEELGGGPVVDGADFDAAAQPSRFDALVRQGVDGVFPTAVASASIGRSVRRTDRAGIPVFVLGAAPRWARGTRPATRVRCSRRWCWAGP